MLKQNTDFLNNMFRKAVFPCMLTILSANINVFVDGILVANCIGADALTAVNLSLPLYLALCVVGSFLASGTAINAAQEIGRNNREESGRYYNDCVAGSFFASVLVTVAGLVFQDALAAFLCSDAAIRPYVRDYVVITLIGALPKIMIYVPFWYLRLDGKNAAVTVMMSVMSIGNIILDLYTDGVPEATNADNEMYGSERLLNILNENRDQTPEHLLVEIKADVDRFVQEAPQFDDITMLCLEYKEPMKADSGE